MNISHHQNHLEKWIKKSLLIAISKPFNNKIGILSLLRDNFQKTISSAAVAAMVFQSATSRGANFIMSGNDGIDISSFNSGADWTGGAAPSAGNSYQTSTFLLRTPADSTSLAFAGNSLEVQNGGDLRDKTSATITVNDLILDNGGIFDMSGSGGVLSGNITLSGGMAYLSVGSGESFTCNALISGSGGLYTYSVVSSGAGTSILTANNTFTGGITVNAGALQVNTSGGSTGLGGGNTTVLAGAILVGGDQDAFGYWPNVAPTTILINGGTVTDLGNTSYRITLPNLTFTGGTLTSAAGNNGDPNGNYSLFGVNGTCLVTTLSNSTTAVISAPEIAIQSPTIFNVAAGSVTGGTTPGVDLLLSSQLVPFGTHPITKIGTGVMAFTGTSTFSGGVIISNGIVQLGTSSDTSALSAPMGSGTVVNNAILNFASSQTVTVTNLISGDGVVTIDGGTAVLTAANTYTGGTMVENGTLMVNNVTGGGTGTGTVTVNNNGILGGFGSITGNVTVNGKTLPGTTAATNAIGGNLTYNFGAQADFHLSPAANGIGNDQITLNGANSILNCGNASVGISLTGASLDEVNDYTLFNLTGGSAVINGNFIATPLWLGTTPANASSYSVITVGHKVLLHYNSNGTTNIPVTENLAASNISFTSAQLNGQLISSGGQYPTVTFYYGTQDGGTNSTAWAYSVSVGLQSGSFSATVSNLTENTAYYFAAAASNSAGTAWATPSQSFSTLALIQATVTNLPASNVQGNSAILNGQILSPGNQTPSVNLYYGPTDGGSNVFAWANSIYIGQQNGKFSITVTGLSTNTSYYYAAAAVNNAGTSWASPSQVFTTLPSVPIISVVTYHNDNARDGANTNEVLLTPATVNTNNFGLLMSYAVDGFIYAQPLYLSNVAIPGLGTHNVVFVATENNSVYAFDADSNIGTNGGLLWHTNLGIAPLSNNGEFGGRYHNDVYIDLTPEVGITGTPVVDPSSETLYVDVLSREVTITKTNYYHRIHALNITTGAEQPYSPVIVTGSVPGTGVGGNGSVVTFNARQQNQRPALTLAGGKLFVAYGSFADTDPYHGWIMAFNATNLIQLTNYIFSTTPNATTTAFGNNAGEGALWMGGDGLCVDTNINLFFETANGSFSQNTNGGDYGDSFVKLSTVNQLKVADYFTPYNQAAMQSEDSDLGSGGPMLLPDTVGSVAHPHLMVGGGKAGIIFLVDRDNMGTYSATSDRDVQEFGAGAGGFFCTPAYFNYQIYYQGMGSTMKAFAISNGVISTSPASSSGTSFNGYGTTPSISANGTQNGIIWSIQTDGASPSDAGAAVLHAYNATNLSQELYNSSQNFQRDNPGAGVKYSVPTVANGKVYVGAQYALSIFGNTAFLATPTISPNGEAFTNSVAVTLTDATPGTAIYYTLDGALPTTNSMLYTGPFTVTSTVNLQAVAVKTGAVNSGAASASFVNTATLGSGTGLIGQYWTNITASAFTNAMFNFPPTLTRTDAVVNFNWTTNGPAAIIGQTNFAVLWTGSLQPQYSETYTLSVVSAGGVRLWINGQLLIDEWAPQPTMVTNSGSITLNSQQLYNLQMEYYQGMSNDLVQLLWSSPSTALNVIPQTQFYTYTNPPPTVILVNPTNYSTYTASASLTAGAEADAPYNPINQVSFYANGSLLGTLSNSPDAPLYTITATSFAAGNYALTAVATDGSGLSSTSSPVNITITSGSGAPYGLITNAPVTAFLNMPTTFTGTLPTLLSQTGVYSDTPNRMPVPGLIPYAPNTPLWSDNAVKSRYLALPNNGGPITPNQQIGFLPTNSWTFPSGTIFIKNFDMVVNQTNANVPVRRLETRLLVRDINGAVYGVTYKWRPDNSDADLLTTSSNEVIQITNAAGVTAQTWYYPSPADCLTCHTPVANYVLGVNTRQLNGNLTYPSTGITDNQLRTLNRLGLFNPAFDEAAITNFEQLSAVTNMTASFQQRARSYLDANCAQCHQPGGTGITFDARYDTPLAQQNITNYPAAFSLGYDHACIIKADDVWRSVLLYRINTNVAAIKMPPLARNLIDTNAVQLFIDWINSLPGTTALAPPNITPNGGNYIGSTSVTLSSANTNATIYYTLDGSLPTTNSLLYSTQLTLINSATITASAFAAGYDNSIAESALFLVQPPSFTGETFLTNQQFQLEFSGVPGSNYVLEATTNFQTWIPISTNTAFTNMLNLIDSNSANYPYRFYRMMQQ